MSAEPILSNASVLLPPTGLHWEELVGVLGAMTLDALILSTPAPFLVKLPRGVLTDPEPLQDGTDLDGRLEAMRQGELKGSRVHYLALREEDKPLLLGRAGKTSHLVLDDPTSSKQHAELKQQMGRWQVRDLHSSNGTTVDGVELSPAEWVPLRSGQVVRFSRYACLFLHPEAVYRLIERWLEETGRAPAPAVASAEPPRPSSRATERAFQVPPLGMSCAALLERGVPRADLRADVPYLLELKDGLQDAEPYDAGWREERMGEIRRAIDPRRARVYRLASDPPGNPVTIGRQLRAADVVLGSEAVSRRHAEVVIGETGWRITDLEAANGTFLEGERVRTGVPLPIESGQIIRFGDFRCVLLSAEDLRRLPLSEADLEAEAGAPIEADGPDPGKLELMRKVLVTPPEGLPLRELVETVGGFGEEQWFTYCFASFLLEIPTDDEVPDAPPPSADGIDRTREISRSRILSVQRSKQVRAARIFTLDPGVPDGRLVLGRDAAECQILLRRGNVSKEHAELRPGQDGGWILLDLGSQNGTWVEGKRLPSGVTVDLVPGRKLSFAAYPVLFLSRKQIYGIAQQIQSKRD